MPPSIIQLEDQLISQIAAGEVVEAPFSVIKELAENAIDAGANQISIAIKGAGLGLIHIADNGHGMSKEDLPLSILRHTTSKIKTLADLERLLTMGFRGEALSSIASVSKMKIISSTGEKAYALTVEGGAQTALEPAARVKGTTIEVSSLFYNVPARRKYQKSQTALIAQATRTVQNLALAHPKVSFTFFIEEKKVLETKNTNLDFNLAFQNATKQVLKENRDYQWIDYSTKDFQLLGYISKPAEAKKNKLMQRLIVNGRPVFSNLVSQAVKEGYATALAENLFPAFILHLVLPSDFVDVNVHPQKKEVRFKEEFFLKEKIKQAIFANLENRVELSPTGEIRPSEKEAACLRFLQETPFYKKESQIFSSSVLNQQAPLPDQMALFKQPDSFQIYTIVGPYCFLEAWPFQKEGVAVIDLKAAVFSLAFFDAWKNFSQEKRLEEEPLEGAALQQVPLKAQRLLLPTLVELSIEEIETVKAYKDLFLKLGLEVRLVGSKTIALDTLPFFVEEDGLEQFFLEIFTDFKNFEKTSKDQEFLQKKLAKALQVSIQSRKRPFALEEAKDLISRFLKLKRSFKDPLGKEILIFLDKTALDKVFQEKK